MRPPRRPLTLIAALLFALLTAGCGDTGPEKKGAAKRPAPGHLVELFPIAFEPVSTVYERTGSLRARRVVRIHNQEEGRITDLPFFEGDRVRAGEVVVRMEGDLLRAELDKAKATTLQARLDLKRLENLARKKAASEDELARARTALNIAVADQTLLETRLAYTRIAAPFDGIVSARLAEPGDVVARHAHLLTLSDPASLVTEIHASELVLPLFHTGDPAKVRIDALGRASFVGRILRIHPELDPISRQGTVEVILDPVPAGARAGQFARVTLETEKVARILVPFNAVKRDQLGEFVYRLDDENRAHRTEVRSGVRIGDKIEILEGLAPGHRIVRRGFLGLTDGKIVEIATASDQRNKSDN